MQTLSPFTFPLLPQSQGLLCFTKSRTAIYEFEDAIEPIDKVDIITIEPENIISKYTQKLIKHSSRIIPQCIDMTPLGLKSYSLNQDYYFLLVIVDFPWNFFWINLLKQWQTRCAVTVCYLIDIW